MVPGVSLRAAVPFSMGLRKNNFYNFLSRGEMV